MNSIVTLSLLSLVLERKMKFYTGISSMDICFILKNMGRTKGHIMVGGSNSNEFEIDYYKKLEEVIEL